VVEAAYVVIAWLRYIAVIATVNSLGPVGGLDREGR
jgi:hypothetical protein